MLGKKINEIIERVKTIDTKCDYVIEQLKYIRDYCRIEEMWKDGGEG